MGERWKALQDCSAFRLDCLECGESRCIQHASHTPVLCWAVKRAAGKMLEDTGRMETLDG